MEIERAIQRPVVVSDFTDFEISLTGAGQN